MPKCSVIIPVYNVEKYLTAALESVINQTFSDIEIICINDGSTDNSFAILENYAQKDSRIKLINQHNQGVSAARNTGIEAACGEYIMFLDPDDTYDLTLCEKVVEKINTETPDIVMWGHNKICNTDIVDKNCYCTGLEYLINNPNASLDKFIVLQVYIWDKAFKKEFLEKNNIKFALGIKQAEDLIFCLLSFYAKPKYSYIPQVLYFYTDYRSDSATAKIKDNIANDVVAYRYLLNAKEFKKQSKEIQIASTQHFLGGSIYYWRTLKDEKYREKYIYDIKTFIDCVNNHFKIFDCRFKMPNYQKLKHLIFKHQHKKFFNLFDIRTTKTDKTYVVFGFVFKFLRKERVFKQEITNEKP